MRKPCRRRVRRLNDIIKWQVDALAPWGFSAAYIASLVFAKGIDEVSRQEVGCVSGYCYRRSLHLKDWRNGSSPTAASVARRAITGTAPARRKRAG
jgi:hypothetical protein